MRLRRSLVVLGIGWTLAVGRLCADGPCPPTCIHAPAPKIVVEMRAPDVVIKPAPPCCVKTPPPCPPPCSGPSCSTPCGRPACELPPINVQVMSGPRCGLFHRLGRHCEPCPVAAPTVMPVAP